MLWYVIQTYTGREEKLIHMMRRLVPRGLYGDCFVAYHEQLRHRQQMNRIHVERIFPGYLFVTSEKPDQLFLYLKQVPAMSKMISDGEFHFLPLDAAEARFLADIMDENHVIRLSYVATDGKDHISYVSGPLEAGLDRVTRYQFRLRYALVRLKLADEEKEVRMGIILNDDVRREIVYGGVEAPITVPEKYRVAGRRREAGHGEEEKSRISGGGRFHETGHVRETDKGIKGDGRHNKAGHSEEKNKKVIGGGRYYKEGCGRENDKEVTDGKQRCEAGHGEGNGKRINGGDRHRDAGHSKETDNRITVDGRQKCETKAPYGSARSYLDDEPPEPYEWFEPGERVIVVSGALAGLPALVCQMKKRDVRLAVHYFGRDMTVEVPADTIKKI